MSVVFVAALLLGAIVAGKMEEDYFHYGRFKIINAICYKKVKKNNYYLPYSLDYLKKNVFSFNILNGYTKQMYKNDLYHLDISKGVFNFQITTIIKSFCINIIASLQCHATSLKIVYKCLCV